MNITPKRAGDSSASPARDLRRIAFVGMAALVLTVAVLAASPPLQAGDGASVFLVDMHSHTAPGPHLRDDGKEALAAQAERAHEAGYHAIFHTPHSDLNTDPGNWLEQRAHEREGEFALSRYLGEEVTVEKGSQWGKGFGGRNNDHLGVVGQDAWIDHALPMKAACERAHATGAVVTLNHPGPGPSMWEAGYWNRPGLRDKIDAIEICNGQIMRAVPMDFFGLYLTATKYRGWGVKLAAVGGTDTHSPTAVPEVATMVVSEDESERALVEAVRQRRTYVVFRLLDLRLTCAQLGQTLHTGDVDLLLECSRKVAKITLYREGRTVKTWTDTDRAEFKETITDNAAYAWRINDGRGRAYSSAIWYEPRPLELPDLQVDTELCAVRGRTLVVAVRNTGIATAKDVVVEAWSGFPGDEGVLLARHTFSEVAAAGREQEKVTLKAKPKGDVFFRVDPEGYGVDEDDAIPELDERNNAWVLLAKKRGRR